MAKPLGILTVALSNLSYRVLRSLLLGGLVTLFVFALFSGSMISLNLQNGIYSLSERLGADLLVVPDGDGKKIESVLLRSTPTTFYLPARLLEVVKDVPGVEKASGQLFVSSLEAQCCSVKVQLIGIDPKTDFVVGPWLTQHYKGELKDDQIIVGNYIVGQPGEKLRFYGKEFTIVAQLEPTGMGFDASVFMTVDAARGLAKIATPSMAEKLDGVFSSILVRVTPGLDPMEVSDGVIDRLSLRDRVNFVYASSLMSATAGKLRRVVDIMMVSAGLLWALALVILVTVFFFAANERRREFASLRAMGARKGWIGGVLMTESVILGLFGSVAGVALGALLVQAFSPVIARAIDLPYLSPSFDTWLLVAAGSALIGVVSAPLSTLPALLRFSRADIYTQWREGE